MRSNRRAPRPPRWRRPQFASGVDRSKVPYITRCEPCGKKALTKENAKKLARMKGKSRYKCEKEPGCTLGWWHVGGLPPEVRQGKMTLDEFRERRNRGREA